MEAQGQGALSGVRVVDFGQFIAGPMVAQLLADYGADVVRVDPPGGPMWDHESNAIMQRGKRSIVLDLKDPADLEVARRLIDSADIVVENFRPGVMDRLGIGPQASLERNPRLIYASIPGFASDDDRAGLYATEGVVAAAAGLYPPHDMDWSNPPVVNTLPLASGGAVLVAANTIAAALIARERGGLGQHVEVSLFDSAYELTRVYMDSPPGSGVHAPPNGFGGSKQYPIARGYECADGRWIRLTWLEGRQIEDFASLIGKHDEWEAMGFYNVGPRRVMAEPDLVERMTREISAAFLTQPADYWEREVGPIADLSVIRTARDWLLYDEQAIALDSTVEVIDPELGVTRQGGSPVTMTKTPPVHRPRRALDADRAEILAELDDLEQAPTPTTGEGVELTSALEGIRAVDTSVLLAGPTACRLLAEYGAEVVHVGNPDWRGMDNFHYQVHGGKRTILLDLKSPEGLDAFQSLTAGADVLSTNFAQTVGRRLGVDEDAVREYNPGIVYSRVSAHGAFGPRADYRGHEEIGQAATGVMHRFGKGAPGGNMQFMLINDDGTGHVAAFGIMIALFHKMRTGIGQFVGSSLAQTSITWQTPYMIDHRTRDWDDPGGLDFRGYGPLEHVYEGSDGRWFYLSAKSVEALAGIDGLDGIATVEPEKLAAELAARFSQQPGAHWETAINGAADPGVSAKVVAMFSELLTDGWALSHGLIEEISVPEVGDGTLIGPAPRMSRTPMKSGTPVGPAGCDTRAVLAEVGLADRIDELFEKGVASEKRISSGLH